MATLIQCPKCKEWKDTEEFRQLYHTKILKKCRSCRHPPNINRKSKLCVKCKSRGTTQPDGLCVVCRRNKRLSEKRKASRCMEP